MNHGKRRRESKAARKVRGADSMSPTPMNLARIMRKQPPRAERRKAGGR